MTPTFALMRSAALDAIAADDEVGDEEMERALRMALRALRDDPSDAVLDAVAGTRFRRLPVGKQEAERKAFAAAIDSILA